MSVMNKLTAKDKEMIGAYIDAYAGDDHYHSASIEYLLRFWEENKNEYLGDLLGGELSVTKEITFKQDIDETSEEVRLAVMHNKEASAFLSSWRDKFGWSYAEKEIPRDIAYILYNMPSWVNLANNRWDEETIVVPFPDGTQFKVQRGAKLSKAMGKIAKAFGLSEEGFEAFRIACSQGLNQKMLKGNLTLSIHPLDYMTMSDNNCDWSSCMSWKEGGCYRQGTVEMMNSPMVIVAYLAAEDTKLRFGYNYEWNSKKWRELILVTPDVVCNILGYPYRNENLSQAALEMVKDLAHKNLGWEFANKKPVIWVPGEKFEPYPFSTSKLCLETETYHMYNDFYDREHFGYFSAAMGNQGGDVMYHSINYSGPAECMCCGVEDPDIDEDGYLVGNCCETVEYCECCGERIYSGDDDGWVDDMHLCHYCMEDRTREDIFGEYHYDDNLKTITLMGDNNKARYDNVYVYYSDWDWACLKRYFKRIYGVRQHYRWNECFYVKVDDLTEEGLELFYYITGYQSPEQLKEMFNASWYTERLSIDLDGCKEYTPDGDQLGW